MVKNRNTQRVNLKERDHMGDLGMGGRMILKWMLK
jgi:hypothetical protein